MLQQNYSEFLLTAHIQVVSKSRDFRKCSLLPEIEKHNKMRSKRFFPAFSKHLRGERTGILRVLHQNHRSPLTQLTQQDLQTQDEKIL